jgi:Kef-type K+ transport system membrane component KefB
MIPRGEVGLIFAHLGLTNGILSPQLYSAILIMVIFTTFLAPPLLKPIFARMDPQPRDTQRPPGHGHGTPAAVR